MLDLTLPAGTTARPPTMADVVEVVAVLRADEHATAGEAHTTAADISSEWRRPSVDLAVDVVVVHDRDRMVGYADQKDGRAWVAVRPEDHGRGIGMALLAWTEAHARHRGLARVGQTTPDGSTAARLLAANGYAPRWQSWVFSIPLDDVDPSPVPPAGVVIRAIRRPAEDRLVHALIEDAFSEWPDRDASMSFEDWRSAHLDRDDGDPDLRLAAIHDGAIVGAALSIEDGDEGWVEQLAVVRSHRGRGIGRALLESAFARFAGRGRTTGGLTTDSRTGARDLYEHVGMTVTSSWTRWSRDLS